MTNKLTAYDKYGKPFAKPTDADLARGIRVLYGNTTIECDYTHIIEKLARYESTGWEPEQIAPQNASSAPGATIFWVNAHDHEVIEESILSLEVLTDVCIMHTNTGQALPVSEFGKTVFSNCEDALAALKSK